MRAPRCCGEILARGVNPRKYRSRFSHMHTRRNCAGIEISICRSTFLASSRAYERVAGKCASKRSEENLGRNDRFVGKGAMSRGALRSEWQYALGLITRNYWHLSLDIRHTCVPTIKAARAASLGAFHRFQFRIAL